MRIANLALAVAFTGSATLAGLAYAQAPAAAHVVNLDEAKETAAIQHLRAARKNLNIAKDTIKMDPDDTAGHAKEMLETIDKAIDQIDKEIELLVKAGGK